MNAHFKVLEATVAEDKTAESMDNYERQMESAINMVKKKDSYHKNIGVYNMILGTKRHAVIKKKLMLPPVKKKIPMQAS